MLKQQNHTSVSTETGIDSKLRWKLSKFFLDPYGSLEVKGTKIWTALPDFKNSYLKFFAGVTKPATERQLNRMNDEERAQYDANRELLEGDLAKFKEYLDLESGDTFDEIMAQYPESEAYRNLVTHNMIGLEFAEYYLLQLGLTLGKLGGYTKFLALACLLGNAATDGVMIAGTDNPVQSKGRIGDLLCEMYSKQRASDLNQEKIVKHPFLQMAATGDVAVLGWITYIANDHFAKEYSKDKEAVQRLMDLILEESQHDKITDKFFLEAIATAYNQSLDDMMQSELLRLMYETLSEEDKTFISNL